MTKTVKICVLVAIAWMLQPAPAAAAAADWLDKLSGPGPFSSWAPSLALNLYCWTQEPVPGKDGKAERDAEGNVVTRTVKRNGTCQETSKVRGMIRARYTPFLQSVRNDLFPDNPAFTDEQRDAERKRHRVTINSFEVGIFARAAPVLDLGTAVSLDLFSGGDFKNFWRGSYKPLAAVLYPLQPLSDRPISRALQISVSERVFFPQIRGRDLCQGQCPQSLRSFTTNGEYSAEILTTVDLGYLFFYKR